MSYSIRVADVISDKDAILSLWNNNLQLISEDRFHWIYNLNPLKPVQCWIAGVDGNGESAGTVSLFPREVLIAGRRVKSGIPGYFAVKKQHRVLGPAVLLQRAVVNACSAGGFEFIYACPNKAAEAAFSRTGYRDLGAIGVYSNPLRSAYVLRRYMSPFLANLFGPVVDFSLRAFSLKIFRRRGGNLQLLEVERFDDRIDQLWKSAAHALRVVGFRSGEYLNWRYKDCPQRLFRGFIVCNEKEQVVAYFVSYRDGKVEKIADFFALNSELLETSLGKRLL